MISEFNSQKFKFWSFVSMVLLVFVHGYNLHDRYMQPWTMPGEPLTITSFTELFLANGIFRFRIPMLFIISGYLYAIHDYKPYKERTNKRLLTLLLPYFIWSAIGLGLLYCFEMIPLTRAMIIDSHMAQIDKERMLLHDYQWYEMLFRWIFIPVSYQLWFIRVLLIYNVAYPAIKWCIEGPRAKWVYFSIVTFFWLGTVGLILFEGEGLLFFSLGILLQKTNFNIDVPKKWLSPVWWGMAFIVLAIIKTLLAFHGEPFFEEFIFPTLLILHKLVIVSGLITAWYGCNGLVKWFMKQKWFVWLTAFSFIIYVLHAPFVAIAIDPVFSLLNQVPYYRMLTFVLLPLATITAAIIIGFILRTISPKFYGILTGGRGF